MTSLTPHPTLRRLPAAIALAAALAVPAAAHAAGPAPTVRVEVGERAIAVAGAGHLGRGPVRLRLSGTRLAHPHTVAVLELKRGVTRADVDAADLAGLSDARAAQRLGRLVAGGAVSGSHRHVTTIVARAREHVVVDVSAADGASAAFRVGSRPSGARLPRADATVALRDDGLRVPERVPARGTLRIANAGDRPHALTAFRLARGVSAQDAARALRHGGSLDRIGRATVLTGLVSAGTVNRVELRLRRGRYLLASLYAPLVRGGRPDVLRGLVGAIRVR